MNKTEVLRQLYYTRLFQEKLLAEGLEAYTEFGEEAITVGSILGLDKDDIVSCYFRGDGAILRMKGGITLEDQMAWWFGKKTSDGFYSPNLPSAWMDTKNGVIGTTSSLIGADDDIAVGAAMAQKMKKTGKVVLLMLGDGATSKGNFHEALNFSSMYNLPMIIMIRSNGWAMSTNIERDISVTSIPDMAKPFKFETATIDGNDIFTVIDTVKKAADHVRSGKSPYLIEAITYRMSGHSAHDDYEYKDEAKVREWAKKDPVALCEKALLKNEISQKDMEDIRTQIKNEIDAAYESAIKGKNIEVSDFLKLQTSLVNKMWGKA